METDQKNTTMNDIVTITGFISAALFSIGQYFFSPKFEFLFSNNKEFFAVSTTVSLILSLCVMIGIFAFRYNLYSKVYLKFWKVSDYYKKLNILQSRRSELDNKSPNYNNDLKKIQSEQDVLKEPWGFTINGSPFYLIFLSILSFLLSSFQFEAHFTSLFYISFILLAVASITIFSVNIYMERDRKSNDNLKNKMIYSKLKDFFAGTISVNMDYTDTSNYLYPVRTMNIMHNGKRYEVRMNANHPELYFNIVELK